jgi:hypothetical protein
LFSSCIYVQGRLKTVDASWPPFTGSTATLTEGHPSFAEEQPSFAETALTGTGGLVSFTVNDTSDILLQTNELQRFFAARPGQTSAAQATAGRRRPERPERPPGG